MKTANTAVKSLTKRKSKYNAVKSVVNGITFASKIEAKRYQKLLSLEKNGLIRNLSLQPMFVLMDKFKYKEKNIRPIKYIADFMYLMGDEVFVEDVKGITTDVFRLKWKLVLNKYRNINFRIIYDSEVNP